MEDHFSKELISRVALSDRQPGPGVDLLPTARHGTDQGTPEVERNFFGLEAYPFLDVAEGFIITAELGGAIGAPVEELGALSSPYAHHSIEVGKRELVPAAGVILLPDL